MKNRILKTFIAAAIVACMVFASSVNLFALEEGYVVREGDNTEQSEGNVIIGLKGTFVTVDEEAKEAILKRVNEIRKEACDNGYPVPGNRSVSLTPSDYVPIKWSTLIEQVAAMRAAEASVYINHGRLGAGDFGNSSSVFKNGYGVRTNAENLAWNWSQATLDGLLYGIEQWYSEKEDWINNTAGAVTGHYTSMINPNMKYIGVAAFYNQYAAYRLTVANQLSSGSTALDETAAGIGENVYQKVKIDSSLVTEINISSDTAVSVGKTLNAEAEATVRTTGGLAESGGKGVVFSGLTWSSSDEKVATVDEYGVITGVSAGKTTITASAGNGVSGSFELTVKSEHTHNFSEEWKNNETEHWHECACGEKDGVAGHVYDDDNDDTCNVCGYKRELPFMPGDVNGDRSVNNKDVVALFKYASGGENEVNVIALDINGDGSVNNKDVVALFKYVSGGDSRISDKPYYPA